MASLHDRAAQRAARDLEEQRRKRFQFGAMMDEITCSDSDSGSDDDGIVMPSRRAGAAGGGGGGSSKYGTGAPTGAARPWNTPKTGGSTGDYGFKGGAGGGAGASRTTATGGGGGGGGDAATDAAVARQFGAFRRTSALMADEGKATGSSSGGGGGGKKKGKTTNKKGDNYSALRALATRVPRADEAPIQCYVVRNKSGKNMFHPKYTVYLEDGDRQILSGKKRMGNKTSNYLMSVDDNPTDRKSDNIVGKLRANFSGSSYMIFDHGLNPAKAVTNTAVRQELGLVSFDYDKMGPGKMTVSVPRVGGTGLAQVFKADVEKKEDDGGLEKAAETHASTIMTLQNKRPKWDDRVGGHVLNFHGRVTMSSVKNFQLGCDELEGDATVLQFGRVGQNKFTMDYQYPLSAVQAFAICLASLDGKLADTKGFDAMKKLKTKK